MPKKNPPIVPLAKIPNYLNLASNRPQIIPTITHKTINIYMVVQDEEAFKNKIKLAIILNKKVAKKPNKNTVKPNSFSPANNSKGPIINAINNRGYLNLSV